MALIAQCAIMRHTKRAKPSLPTNPHGCWRRFREPPSIVVPFRRGASSGPPREMEIYNCNF